MDPSQLNTDSMSLTVKRYRAMKQLRKSKYSKYFGICAYGRLADFADGC